MQGEGVKVLKVKSYDPHAHFYYSVVSETKLVTDGKNISTATANF